MGKAQRVPRATLHAPHATRHVCHALSSIFEVYGQTKGEEIYKIHAISIKLGFALISEHQTKSQWMNPTVREEAGDLKEKLDKANAEIITEEQIIAHKQDKLQDLRQTIQGELAPSTGI